MPTGTRSSAQPARCETWAIRDGYRGSEQPARAFSLALLLDELGRHVRDLEDELRAAVVQACRMLLGDAAG